MPGLIASNVFWECFNRQITRQNKGTRRSLSVASSCTSKLKNSSSPSPAVMFGLLSFCCRYSNPMPADARQLVINGMLFMVWCTSSSGICMMHVGDSERFMLVDVI